MKELFVGSAGIILLIVEIAQQDSLMERWSSKCQSNTVSLCIPPGAGEVCEQTADRGGSRRCDRMLLMLFQISSALPSLYPARQWYAETFPVSFHSDSSQHAALQCFRVVDTVQSILNCH